MSYVDEAGVGHPLPSEEVTPWGLAHIACCSDCMVRFGATARIGFPPVSPLPLDRIGVPPEPTGRARHRKEEP